MDLAPTILAIAGAPAPVFIQGMSFMGDTSRRYVFAGRDRMDATVDHQRAVRNRHFKYVRNEMPELAYLRPLTFRDMFPIMRELWDGLDGNRLNPVQRYYFVAPRPREELYNLDADPWEVENLAGEAAYDDTLAELRAALVFWPVRGPPQPPLARTGHAGQAWKG